MFHQVSTVQANKFRLEAYTFLASGRARRTPLKHFPQESATVNHDDVEQITIYGNLIHETGESTLFRAAACVGARKDARSP